MMNVMIINPLFKLKIKQYNV